MNEIKLFEYIAERQLSEDRPIKVGELVRWLRIPRATLHRYLNGLVDSGYLIKIRHGQYIVSGQYVLSMLLEIHRSYNTDKWIVAIHSERGK